MDESLVVREIDVEDESQLRSWWEVGAAASAGRPPESWTPWPAARRELPVPDPETEAHYFVVSLDGETVGSAWLGLPRNDNTHLAVVDVFVAPDRGRRGVGGRLLAHAEEAARAQGRTTVLADCYVPPGEDTGSATFARRHGFVEANAEQIREVTLVEFDQRIDGLAELVAARLGDYRIVDYVGLCPPAEYVVGYCAMLSTFLSQIPLGDLDLSDSEWTPERLRTLADRQAAIGRVTYGSLAISPDGSVVGCSDLTLSRSAPRRARIGITIVSEDHRGHRLGLALKVANHRSLRGGEPDCERIQTSNAGVNAHMVAINDQMGYRVVEHLHEMQKVLS